MAAEEIVIQNIARTSIQLDELAVPNRTGGANAGLDDALMDADDKSFGGYRPVVFINGYYVEKYLDYLEMDMTGFLPEIRFKFTMGNPMFISVNYPKDGDVVSVYFRSWVSVYRPLRMDFNVLNVRSSPSENSEGTGLTFYVLGEARIPGLYNQVSKAFRTRTSYDTLFDVSQDLDLGFSTNEAEVVDTMTWICPNLSYYDFIKEVVSRSYKDDRSFFTCFIDGYYNLNFVNLSNQLSTNNVSQTCKVIRGTRTGSADDTAFAKTQLSEEETGLLLTNEKGSTDLPFFISGYTLLSKAGNVTNHRGYVQEVQFWDEGLVTDNPLERYVAYTIESLTTENVGENMILQKGRVKENEYLREYRKNWYGVLNNYEDGGVHENFIQALIQNDLNNDDLQKFTLQVETNSYYGGFYRGQVIPVAIYVNDQGIRKQNAGASNNQNTEQSINPVLDRFLSGLYVIMGIQVYYDKYKGIYMVLNLNKREWTLNSAGAFPKVFPLNLVSG